MRHLEEKLLARANLAVAYAPLSGQRDSILNSQAFEAAAMSYLHERLGAEVMTRLQRAQDSIDNRMSALEAQLIDRIDRLTSTPYNLVARMDQLDEILVRNGKVHQQQQQDILLKMRALERRIWIVLGGDRPVLDVGQAVPENPNLEKGEPKQ